MSDDYYTAKNQRRRNLQNKRAHPNDSKRRRGGNSDLKQVYADTKQWFESNKVFPATPTLYDQADLLDFNLHDHPEQVEQAVVEVRDCDSLDLAMEYVADGLHPMVLNMASDYRPGGGVTSGKLAQEECLFRRSNAFMSHPQRWYPLDTTQTVYSPDVLVIKDADYIMLDEDDMFSVGMLAVAGLRKPNTIDGEYHDGDRRIMSDKIESIFQIALLEGHDSLVLGALGCGAFQNPPTEVAAIYRDMLRMYGVYFERIGFAVLVARPSDQQNFNTFSKLATRH